jgi:hypothetical protein
MTDWPLGRVFSFEYGGEHYIFDAFLGGVYALVVHYVCRLWEQRTT